MPRYVAFLRGISPLNAKMSDLVLSFQHAGFANVRTVLGTGNVVFDSRATSDAVLERKAEAAMEATLGHTFYTIVRPTTALQAMLQTDPYLPHAVAPEAKRIVSFLRSPVVPRVPLPLEKDQARVLCQVGREVFTAYERSPKGPVFMTLIAQAFGRDITSRTWETVQKCAAA